MATWRQREIRSAIEQGIPVRALTGQDDQAHQPHPRSPVPTPASTLFQMVLDEIENVLDDVDHDALVKLAQAVDNYRGGVTYRAMPRAARQLLEALAAPGRDVQNAYAEFNDDDK